MRDLYDDMSPLQVWLKPPQIGATVAQIIKTMYVAHKLKKDIIYTLPTQGDVQDMAGGKINRIIAQNQILKDWVHDHDTVEQKSIGENIIHYRGSFTTKSAMMVSSDLNVHDEIDASDQSVIEQYETRLQAKPDGWRWYFSHPSAVDYGVDKYWQQSDQKHWFITCPNCQEEQFLSWPESIDNERRCYVCKECGMMLSDEVRGNGKWRAKYGKKWQEENGISKPFSGYWISQLMCPWITAEKILKDFEDKSTEYFYNYVLGLPYDGGGSKLSQKHLFQNLTGIGTAALDNERIVMGCDTGAKLDFVIGNQRLGLFYHGEAETFTDLDKLMQRWKNMIVVMDAGGTDLVGPQSFYERWPGRVFLMYFTGPKNNNKIAEWGEGDKFGTGIIMRDFGIQLVVDEFRNKRIPLQGLEGDWIDYYLDWSNLTRIKLYDEKTGQFKGIKWIRNGRDHRALATVLWRAGIDKFQDTMADIVMPKNDFASQGY